MMAKRALKMMMDGVNDAIAFAEGDHSRGRVNTVPDANAIRKTTRRQTDVNEAA